MFDRIYRVVDMVVRVIKMLDFKLQFYFEMFKDKMNCINVLLEGGIYNERNL